MLDSNPSSPVPHKQKESGFDYDNTTFKCDLTKDWTRIYFYTLESLLPCGLMMTGCFSIIFQIWRNTKKLRAAGMSLQLANQRFRSMLKSTALLLALLFLFLACVIPICVYNVYVLLSDKETSIPVGIVIFMFYWIQYGVNFLVYAASNANYRSAYKQFLKLFAHQIFRATRMKKSREEGQSPKMSSLPSVQHAHREVTSVALMPLRAIGENRVLPPQYLMPVRSNSQRSSRPMQSLQRLKSYPADSQCKEYERRVHTFPTSGGHFWYGVMWRADSQSTQSSVMTLESTITHEAEAPGVQ